ncbi:hypothetical protein LOTGIDRAFT_238035 [Lottia gigantea]|uniref:RRM domain-containing protein n=1 Tax=Lottia gigantea TaxID=225164 RepID=V4AXI9_LOTGI|nr:hypothetical protein LOTGIDRAFT_238035 [Lottia gigantea]ESP02308.1 hypothetical protein LOTGIDRAFT_238035 [Lottia gigantea]
MTFKIFIGNLSHEAQESDLRPAFEKYGAVAECAVLSSYGFVHMENEDEAQAAIEGLNGYDICGLRIRVEMSHGKKGDGPRRGGRGGRGGRGSSRGGGRGRDGPRGGGGRPSPYDRYPPPSSSYYDRYDPYSRYPYPERDYYRPLPPVERYRMPPSDRYAAPRDRYAAERPPPDRYAAAYERERLPARDARSAYPAYDRGVERDAYYGRERGAAADYYGHEAERSAAPVSNGYSYRGEARGGYAEDSYRAPGNSQSSLQTQPIYF